MSGILPSTFQAIVASLQCSKSLQAILVEPHWGLSPSLGLQIKKPRKSGVSYLAGQEGLEPPTLGFGDRCSAKLSYWPS